MIRRIRALISAHRELCLYLVFGGLTTLVGFGVYYAILFFGRAILGIPTSVVTGSTYLALYTAAQILQWVAAVLFAFFTNRAYVFKDAPKDAPVRQLLSFSAGRLVTLLLDFFLTRGATVALVTLAPSLCEVLLLGRAWNLCEILSKLIAAVAVIICNYLISKLWVFRNAD